MPCPTCDHTVQLVNNGSPPVFWCPRCGTLLTRSEFPTEEQPMLVERVLKARCRMSSTDLVQGGIDDCLPLDANQLGGDVTVTAIPND